MRVDTKGGSRYSLVSRRETSTVLRTPTEIFLHFLLLSSFSFYSVHNFFKLHHVVNNYVALASWVETGKNLNPSLRKCYHAFFSEIEIACTPNLQKDLKRHGKLFSNLVQGVN